MAESQNDKLTGKKLFQHDQHFSLARVVRAGQGCFGCGLSGLSTIGRQALHGLCPLAGHQEGGTPVPTTRLGEQTCQLPVLPQSLPTILCPQKEASKHHRLPRPPGPEHSQAHACTCILTRLLAHTYGGRDFPPLPASKASGAQPTALLAEDIGQSRQGRARNTDMEGRLCQNPRLPDQRDH